MSAFAGSELTGGLAVTCGPSSKSRIRIRWLRRPAMLVFGETWRFPCPVAADRVGPLWVETRLWHREGFEIYKVAECSIICSPIIPPLNYLRAPVFPLSRASFRNIRFNAYRR